MTTADGTVQGATQIFGTAPRNRAFSIVLLADGFTTAQQTDFNIACDSFVTALRATPPYDVLAPAINVWRVNVTGRRRPGQRRRHRRHGADVLRLQLRRQRHPSTAHVQRDDRAGDRGRAGS
jgi:hypothetical protein